ncbi:MAG: hypothetical protein WD426_20125 [Anditalea sp.]
MDQTHIHLITNHIPVIGSFFGIFVLIYGMIMHSYPIIKAAYYIFIICAVGAAVTFWTGEAAEETIERMGGISEAVIEKHEDSAGIALLSMIILGSASIGALLYPFYQSSFSKLLSYIILAIALISFGITVNTSRLGGNIRHTEIVNNQP